MPGPPPTPTNILKMRGSWRAKTRKDEPEIKVEAPKPPSFLGREGAREWRRVVSEMERLEIVSSLDRTALYNYAAIYQQLYEIAKLRDEETDPERAARLRKEERETAKEMRMHLTQLGFSPTSRTKVAKIESAKTKNALEELLDS